MTPGSRRFPIGAKVTDAGVHFRTWAPIHQKVDVVIDGRGIFPLMAEDAGYFSGLAENAQAGSRYRYKLDGAKRFQIRPLDISLPVPTVGLRWWMPAASSGPTLTGAALRFRAR